MHDLPLAPEVVPDAVAKALRTFPADTALDLLGCACSTCVRPVQLEKLMPFSSTWPLWLGCLLRVRLTLLLLPPLLVPA